jgi:hypothetical protein
MNTGPHAAPLRGSLPPEGAEPPWGGPAAARLLRRSLAWAAVLAALLATFALYQRPDFLVNLADRVWSCF